MTEMNHTDELFDEELQNIGVKFTDETLPFKSRPKAEVQEGRQNRDKDWREIQQMEESDQRGKRLLMGFGLIVTTAVMIAFIQYEQMTCILGMSFNAILAAIFGYNMR